MLIQKKSIGSYMYPLLPSHHTHKKHKRSSALKNPEMINNPENIIQKGSFNPKIKLRKDHLPQIKI